MGGLRLVYHGGVDSTPPPKISAPMAPMDMKLYMLEVFGLYFLEYNIKVKFYGLKTA